jgi:membrane protein
MGVRGRSGALPLLTAGIRRPSSPRSRELARRVLAASRPHHLTDWAAALTYYGMLSVFPALIVLVALLGLAGDSATESALRNIERLGPGPAQEIVGGAIREVSGSQGTAGAALLLGMAAALWSASGYIGAFCRAAGVIRGVAEDRPFWRLRPAQIAITLLLLALVALSAIAVVASGPLARRIGDVLGVEGAAVTIWSLAKWPVIAAVVIAAVAVLYRLAPRPRDAAPRRLTPGGLAAVATWIAASAGFALYVGSFGSYNRVYGSLAAVIAFMVWLWLSNLAMLLGLELDAELERGREGEREVPRRSGG